MARAGEGSALTCTPDILANAYPCLKCVPESELLAALVAILCLINGGTCDADSVQDDASCMKCLNEHEMFEAIVTVLYNYGISTGAITTGTLLELAGCGLCLDEKVLKAALVRQICAFFNSLLNPV